MTLTLTGKSDLLFTAENVKSICAVILTQRAKSDLTVKLTLPAKI